MRPPPRRARLVSAPSPVPAGVSVTTGPRPSPPRHSTLTSCALRAPAICDCHCSSRLLLHSTKIGLALSEEDEGSDVAEAQENAEHAWAEDSKGRDTLSRKRWLDTIFELADVRPQPFLPADLLYTLCFTVGALAADASVPCLFRPSCSAAHRHGRKE